MFHFFESRVEPFPEEANPTPPDTLVGFCWHYVKNAAGWILLVTLLTTLTSIGQVSLFALLGVIVDWLTGTAPEALFAEKGHLLIWMAVFAGLLLPFTVFLKSMVHHQVIMSNLPMAIRWRMHTYLLGQSMGFYANEFSGRVATKVMQTALAVRQVVNILLDVFVYVVVYIGSTFLLLGSSDWLFTLPLAAWLAVYVLIVRLIIPRLTKVSQAQADARSAMTGRIVDSYTNIATVKLFSHSGREEAYARRSMSDFLKTVYPMMRLATIFDASVFWLNCLMLVGTGALGVYLWSEGLITVGAIAVALGLAMRINNMSQWIMWEISNLFENIGVVYDGIALMKQPMSVKDKDDARELMLQRGEIRFDNVSFHYGKGAGVISDLSLDIRPGERVGLVGRSGAGKSTIANLLLRFYDVEGGTISIDGQSISDVTQDSLRRQIAMVSQDTSLLHRSLRDNIAYGRPGANDEDVKAAALKANAWEFIQGLEDQQGRKGLDAQVGERGVKLSGGQRQRIAIARVFLKNAPILILDEATSALDSEVEAAIQDHLFDLMEGKTVVAIAHRLSTIAAMDRLIVLDHGRIIEQGSHDQLLAHGGVYADLWARQTGGVLADQAARREEEV
ncbi:MAG: multidrug ABC transporter ATP-binding protein [Ponticaulis sp.]|nr:multidrug ABC transporter ATP-binding protein [Ponticaulis sp.]|tara:strand:- start:35249 stop:37102 length:1854 start_codon:yes stop_codon:yes gene_type:complete